LCYAFSRNADGSQDRTSTVYPALAWWNPESTGGKSILAHPEVCLEQFAAHTLNTDWGLRDVANEEKIYDGLSYHQGSVWPLFTGWATLAEYRGNQPLAGYQMLMENANLTWAQDLGADTELLSGDFYVPMGRSTSHQLWSSAMVITPTLRGLFGISIDAQTKTITVNPHLPASWDRTTIDNLALAGELGKLNFSRVEGTLRVTLDLGGDLSWKLQSTVPGAVKGNDSAQKSASVVIPIHALEASLPPQQPPVPGSRTSQFRVLSESYQDHKLTLTFEGLADSSASVDLSEWARKAQPLQLKIDASAASDPKNNRVQLVSPVRESSSATTSHQELTIHFPPGEGWETVKVTLAW